ncbi:MAG: hypothetical protein PVF28_05815, partial [Thioalkalispiraceae bacterium]
MFKQISLILVMVVSAATGIAEQPEPTAAEALLNEVKVAEKELQSKKLDISGLRQVNKKLTTLQAQAQECIDKTQEKVEEKKASLAGLGEKHKKESPELKQQRKQQEEELAQAETELATCNAMLLRISAALEDGEQQLQKKLATQLLAQRGDIFSVISKNFGEPVNWVKEILAYSKKHGWLEDASEHQLWILLGVIILSIVMGLLLKRYLTPVIARIHFSSEPGGRFAGSMLGSFCHDAPYLLGSIAPAIILSIYTKDITPTPFITALAYGLVFFFVARYFIRLALQPARPGKLFLNIKKDIANALARRLKVLTVILLLGYLLVDTLIGASLPEYALSLARSAIRIAFAVN